MWFVCTMENATHAATQGKRASENPELTSLFCKQKEKTTNSTQNIGGALFLKENHEASTISLALVETINKGAIEKKERLSTHQFKINRLCRVQSVFCLLVNHRLRILDGFCAYLVSSVNGHVMHDVCVAAL